MKVAVVHDWLVTNGGAEKVLEGILTLFPEADVHAVIDFLPPELRGIVRHRPVRTTFIQKLPAARTLYRNYLPLMPLAVEQFDLSGYDLVITSSHAVAKGVLTGPDQLHISYVHTPIRYAWDLQNQYLRDAGLDRGIKGWLARWMLHRIRRWDLRTVNGVDRFVANSHFIAQRISRVYGRTATVVYPPVDVDSFLLREAKEDFYLTASRMVPYKRIDLIVAAFARMPERKLVVIGDGPELSRIKKHGAANVTFMGYQPQGVLMDFMQRARAFVFAAEEDFGIAPVEAQACGTPVIAFGKGGALETVIGLDGEKPTGLFFPEQSVSSLVAAVDSFEQEHERIHPISCRQNALRFSPDRFRRELAQAVDDAWETFATRRRPRS